jgi:NADPH:quinone reductase-like Zn-dependent oxidoreductase
MLFPTTLVGSYPQPEWLIDRKKLAGRFPPRVRAKELWRIAEPYLAEAAGGPAHLVLDPLYGVPAAAAAQALGPGGRLVNLGSSADATAPMESAALRSSSLRVLGYTNNELSTELRREALTHVVQEAAAGRLTVEHERVPLADVTAAWARQVAGQAGGRIVLIPEPVPLDSQET